MSKSIQRGAVTGSSSPRLHSVVAASTGKRIASVLAFTVIYALCFAAIKTGLAFAPPLFFGGVRALIGGTALLGLLVVLRVPLFPARGRWPLVLSIAATSTTIGFGAMFLSPGRAGAGIASVLGNTQPLFAVVLAALFLGERATRGKLTALALGLAGVTLIAYPALAGANGYGIWGAALALAASAGTAAGSVLVKRAGLEHGLITTAAWQLIAGSLPLLAISAIAEGGAAVTWNLEFIAILLFLALVGTSFATALWYWLLQREEVGKLTMFLFLVPVAGLAIAGFVVGEQIGLLEIGGAVLTVAAIGAVIKEEWHKPAETGKTYKADKTTKTTVAVEA